jgi:hypothetical protein
LFVSKCELLILVPPLAVLFAKNKELVAKYDLSKVHTMLCGAAVLLPDVAAELLRVIPIKSNHIAHGYYKLSDITISIIDKLV